MNLTGFGVMGPSGFFLCFVAAAIVTVSVGCNICCPSVASLPDSLEGRERRLAFATNAFCPIHAAFSSICWTNVLSAVVSFDSVFMVDDCVFVEIEHELVEADMYSWRSVEDADAPTTVIRPGKLIHSFEVDLVYE